MSHTSGPWKYDGASSIISKSEWFIEFDEEDNEVGIPVVVVNLTGAMGGSDPKADALLIAAAPELLEALIEVIAISDREHEAWNKAKAAIRRATMQEGNDEFL